MIIKEPLMGSVEQDALKQPVMFFVILSFGDNNQYTCIYIDIQP